MKRGKHWWNKPITGFFSTRAGGLVVCMAIVIVVEIIWSPAARVWFGLLVISAFAIVVFLRYANKGGNL